MFNFTGEDSTKCPFGCGGAGDGYGGCAQPTRCLPTPAESAPAKTATSTPVRKAESTPVRRATSTPVRKAESTQGGKRYEVIRDHVSVYPEPDNAKRSIVGSISKNEYVDAINVGDGWLKVTDGQFEGNYVKLKTKGFPHLPNLREITSGGGSKTLKRKKRKYSKKSTKRKSKKKGSKKRRKSKKKTKRRS